MVYTKHKYMAFWKYDLYPYLLYGEIDEKQPTKLWKNKICYYISSYQGYYAPEFILPVKQGQILANLLDELKSQKRNAEKRLLDEYIEHLNRILKENNVDYKSK
jgi:hypothetical protein